MAYAHEQGVVHRDIKPENVLLSAGTAVVTDFGIAKAISASRRTAAQPDTASPAASTLTSVGTSLGTPAYMAPEQAVGSVVDARADLYAWGVMAYELLAGAHPFARCQTPQAMIAAHIAESPAPLNQLNAAIAPPLASIVMRCLAKDPDARPATAHEVLESLDDRSGMVNGTPRGAAPAASGRSQGRRLIPIGITVLALVAGGGRLVCELSARCGSPGRGQRSWNR